MTRRKIGLRRVPGAVSLIGWEEVEEGMDGKLVEWTAGSASSSDSFEVCRLERLDVS